MDRYDGYDVLEAFLIGFVLGMIFLLILTCYF